MNNNIFRNFNSFIQKSYLKLFLGSILWVMVINAFGYNTVEIGRYITVVSKPKASQTDLLSQSIQMKFPQSVETVGDAINYMLRLSGYTLVPDNRLSGALKTTLSKSLPAVDRNFGPMTLKEGLITLAGPAFNLVHDPLNRTVDFQLKPEFIKLTSK